MLHLVQDIVGSHMDDILKSFKGDAKITVAVRFDGKPEQDFVMTSDDPREVIAMMERRIK